jgi:hypothetical protein
VEAHKDLEHVVTINELKIAVHQGKKRKAPARDGICNEFFQYTWDVTKQDILKILNEIYIGGEVLHSQKVRVLVCIPKKTCSKTTNRLPPFNLLNAELKIMSRIIAKRLKNGRPTYSIPINFVGYLIIIYVELWLQ